MLKPLQYTHFIYQVFVYRNISVPRNIEAFQIFIENLKQTMPFFIVAGLKKHLVVVGIIPLGLTSGCAN
jgi:hypothetical protein